MRAARLGLGTGRDRAAPMTVSLYPSQLRWLYRQAKRRGLTLSGMVRLLVDAQIAAGPTASASEEG